MSIQEIFYELLRSYIALTIAFFFLLTEAVFYCWYRKKVREINRQCDPPKVPANIRQYIFESIKEDCKEKGLWRVLGGWFYPPVEPHEVGTENFMQLLAWAFFYKEPSELNQDEVDWCQEAIRQIGEELNFKPKAGNSGVVCVRHTMDPVRARHRPLFLYITILFVKRIFSIVLRMKGFKPKRCGMVSYWTYSAEVDDIKRKKKGTLLPKCGKNERSYGKTDETLVFFHGISLGVCTYVSLLFRLRFSRMILPEMPWVSMNPWAVVPPTQHYAEDLYKMFSVENVCKERLVLAGHSFGSLPIVWLKQCVPSYFESARIVLLDPVCLLLHLPDVCVNFLYKSPKNWYARLIRYMGSEELGIAACLSRRFFWTEGVLFPKELSEGKASVILSALDHVVPSTEAYLACQKLPGIATILLEGLDHGQFLGHPKAMGVVVDCLHGDEICTRMSTATSTL